MINSHKNKLPMLTNSKPKMKKLQIASVPKRFVEIRHQMSSIAGKQAQELILLSGRKDLSYKALSTELPQMQ
jgi:hypothetical protein